MNLKPAKIIAVDFDGTLCENKWPEIGAANEELIEYLRDRQKNGDKLILWTCRVDDMLRKAVEWCKEKGLVFDEVNENLPEIIESFGSDTRKIFANEYIDDRNIWPLEEGVADVLYLCDGKRCGDTCPGVECKHTSDIAHARNFIGKPITKFGKTDIELISQKGSNTLPEWIYSPVNDLKWDDLFEQIERALGFKLFIWQKTYIMGIGFRRSGQTTAEILRLLVGNTVLPYIRLERPKSKQEDLKQKELIKIKEKLDSKGIISRNIEREYY
jgi:hypothetical protein